MSKFELWIVNKFELQILNNFEPQIVNNFEPQIVNKFELWIVNLFGLLFNLNNSATPIFSRIFCASNRRISFIIQPGLKVAGYTYPKLTTHGTVSICQLISRFSLFQGFWFSVECIFWQSRSNHWISLCSVQEFCSSINFENQIIFSKWLKFKDRFEVGNTKRIVKCFKWHEDK